MNRKDVCILCILVVVSPLQRLVAYLTVFIFNINNYAVVGDRDQGVREVIEGESSRIIGFCFRKILSRLA